VNAKRFPDFGKEAQQPFPVREYCYDCTEFYDGCNAWPANRAFDCADYHRLPDVMPGTCGQVVPPSRMQDRKEPNVRGEVIADSQGDSPAPSPVPTRKQPAVARRQLEHSSPQPTNDVYTNVDPVLRQAVSQLPVSAWL